MNLTINKPPSMTECPDCKGQGKVFGHASTIDPKNHGFQWLKCFTCSGVGALNPDEMQMREMGADVRAARMRYGLGLRRAAAILELSALELSEVERGKRHPPAHWLYMLSSGKEIR